MAEQESHLQSPLQQSKSRERTPKPVFPIKKIQQWEAPEVAGTEEESEQSDLPMKLAEYIERTKKNSIKKAILSSPQPIDVEQDKDIE